MRKRRKNYWCEVRNNYADEENTVYIDAWKTANEDEEGEVIAKVDQNGKVEYLNELAKTDQIAQEIIKETQFYQLAEKAYGLYIEDWCKVRGYNVSDVDEEFGINGECYACFEEFKEIEFRNEEYMKNLLNQEDYNTWKQIMS